jgi:hypothetical protein
MARHGHLLLRPFSAPVDPMEIEQRVDPGRVIPIDSHALSNSGRMIVENGLAGRYNERTPEAAITPHRGFV